MNGLTKKELDHLIRIMAERKSRLLQEIREVLIRTGDERYARLAGEVADTGDESVADLLSDVSHAEVARDVNEVRDIVAAEGRIAAGQYGLCINCGAEIEYQRLAAYPSAKRCLQCQQNREKTHASAGRPSL
ncbi:MAG: conjugal transfer protein TraR [Betaproteobacteria bacterium RIFCSPLOWO2_12_FULL_62_58]|nr:MAG: conjugal transfer protein TraR [Betaproteobacteria bacterium RIFCSPLOWO2_12_FULL_62_58]